LLNHLVETEAIGPADVEADPDSMREAALADPEDRVDLAVEADAAEALAAEAGKAADPVAGKADLVVRAADSVDAAVEADPVVGSAVVEADKADKWDNIR